MTVTNPDFAIEVSALHKSFGKVHALRGIDFAVPRGSVLGMLGPNGAGKTTAVRVLTTLLRPDSGRVIIEGYDVVRDAAAVRRRIGLAGQSTAIQLELTGRENLEIMGRLNHMPRPASGAAPLSCSSDSTSRTPPTVRRRPIRAACSGAWIWLQAWSRSRPCSFSTSRPPVSTPTGASACGTSSVSWWAEAPRCC